MRVTTFSMSQQYMTNLNNIMSRYQNLEQEATTGYAINKPSDNPVKFSADLQTQEAMKDTNQWDDNAKTALSTMNTANTALSSLQSALGSVRTQIVQATNGTNTTSDMKQIASVVKQQINNVAQIANTNDGSQYIFSGTNGNTKPLSGSVSSGSFTWSGNNQPQNTDIGNGVKLQMNTSIGSVFNSSSSSSQNLMKNLMNIYNDLNSGSTSGLQSDLKDLDSNIANVTTVQSDLGGRMDRAQSADSQLSQMSTLFQNQKGQLQDANMAQVITQLSQQQTVYTAALTAGEKMMLPTLATLLG